MKRYKTRPGVVLTKVCGQYYLVAAKPLREELPYTAQINETAAFCWRVLEQGADLETLAERVAGEYAIEQTAELREDLRQLMAQLSEHRYVIEEA